MEPIDSDRGMSTFPRNVLAIPKGDRACLRGLAREVRALEAQADALFPSAGSDLAEFVLLGHAAVGKIRAFFRDQARAFLAGDAADSYFHF
jgi:hypothetical protein